MPKPSSPELNLTAGADRSVWLRVGALFDGVSRQPIAPAHLVYNARALLHVGAASPPADILPPGQSQPNADLPRHTALPGLIEAHAHFFLEGGETDAAKRAAYLTQTPEVLLAEARKRLAPLARLGVVGVRDAGDKHGVGLALAKLCQNASRPLMPYIDSPGAALHRRGRYGSFMGEPMENFPSPSAAVEARVREGAARIKLIATGIIDFKKGAVTTEPQMTSEEIGAFTAAARNFGRQTFAHATGTPGIERVIEGGADSVEHGFFVTDEQLAKMRDRQIAWVPTFAPVQFQVDAAAPLGWDATVTANLQRILDRHAASLRKAHDLGVLIVAGSDAGSFGVPHGFGFLWELELMERAGLPTEAVIRAATGTSAGRLGFAEKFGQLKPSWSSRFLLTEHSPLEKIENLRRPKIVIFDGAPLESGEIDAAGL
ncbi:MAG TPA: amidohydrolase family protein [Verrucomicrobiae bacterium]|jgi:imidazolonepropionase-like amidohydrolase|nr:amidohydrolase family protein [Verrucomicrobiae bacterium]